MPAYWDIVSRRRDGLVANMARLGLYALSWPYRGMISARNFYYDLNLGVSWLGCPCVSVGNLTTGGTGKTPLVTWLARELNERGKKVAILSRGYKGAGGANDELLMVSRACPHAVCVANPNRVLAARYAIQEHQVDVILLDDGFQHRRVGRDLDVVLIDTTRPFGFGHLLPRGLLREPLPALGRAGVIILTRASQVTMEDIKSLKQVCADVAPQAPVLACNHQPSQLVDIDDRAAALGSLVGRRVLAFAGIGNPEGFGRSIVDLGVKPLKVLPFPDHHHYTPSDCRQICEQAQGLGADLLLTTEKDLVKLCAVAFDWPLALWALKINIDFVGKGGKILLQMVEDLFEEQAHADDASRLSADRPE